MYMYNSKLLPLWSSIIFMLCLLFVKVEARSFKVCKRSTVLHTNFLWSNRTNSTKSPRCTCLYVDEYWDMSLYSFITLTVIILKLQTADVHKHHCLLKMGHNSNGGKNCTKIPRYVSSHADNMFIKFHDSCNYTF